MTHKTDPSLYKSNFERNRLDRYWTEHWVTEALLRHLAPTLQAIPGHVYDPACGRGDILRVMADHLVGKLAGSDIDMGEFDTSLPAVVEQRDFLAASRPDFIDDASAIVMNPPYQHKLSEKFVRHAINMDGIFCVAALLRSEFKHAKTRNDLFRDNPYFAREIVLTARPRWDWWFREKPEASPRHNYSWFVWDMGWEHDLGPTMHFEGKG